MVAVSGGKEGPPSLTGIFYIGPLCKAGDLIAPVLLEPTSIVAKAWTLVDRFAKRCTKSLPTMDERKRWVCQCVVGGAFDARLGFHKAALVRVDDLKPVQRLAVAAGQAPCDLVECQPEFVTLELHRLKNRTGTNDFLAAIGSGQRQHRQAPAHFLFVRRMDIFEIADVVDLAVP